MRPPGLMLAAGLSFALSLAPLTATEAAAYQLGDTVSSDVVAPAPLMVVDATATEALKQKEALKVPAIFFYHPGVADEVEQSFRTRFSTVRSNFFDAMGAVYQRKRLNPQWLNSTRFKTLSTTFRRQHPAFPQLTNLIAIWATGKLEESDVIENALAGRLREAMGGPIRADALPPDIKLGAHVRILTVTNQGEAFTFEFAEQRATMLHRTNFLTLNRARLEFQQLVPSTERGQAKFLASFLKPNCVLNEELTVQSRRRQVDPLYVADRYEAGQIIARRGQKVDAKTLAALEQLNSTYSQTPHPGDDTPVKEAWMNRVNSWWWAGLGLAGAGLIVGAWQLLIRKRKAISILPARVAGEGAAAGIVSCPSCDENIVIPAEAVENMSSGTPTWRQRALAAEQRVDRAHAAIHAGVFPHLAEWLKQKFVRGLFAERQQMLDAQRSAASELVEMEQRLDELHTPLQERLHAYEKRIAQLEKSLAAKGEENRELLKVRIQLTRQQLERERGRKTAELN